jgi:hypothetical protein
MSIFGLDLKSLRRTQKAVRWAESQYSGQGNGISPAIPLEGDGEVWFKCDGTAPGGYDGSGWFPGSVIDVRAGLTQVALGDGLLVDPNGVALDPDGIYRAIYYGQVDWTGGKRPAYLVTGSVTSSGLSANYIGETCLGFRDPFLNAAQVTSGGAYGYGYTEVYVPVGTPSNPEATLETWRLQHNDHRTGYGVWGATKMVGFSGTLTIPNLSTVSTREVRTTFRFMGKRGDAYDTNKYNCYSYSPFSFVRMGSVKVSEGGDNNCFTFDGLNFYQTNFHRGTFPVLGTQQVVKWNNQGYMGSSSTQGSWINIQTWWSRAKRGPEFVPAIIGYTWPVGWHVVAVDPVPEKINGFTASSYFNGTSSPGSF